MMALTASTVASASLTIEQLEFVAGCLLGLLLLLAVHLAVPTSRFEYDKAIQQARSESESITQQHRRQQQVQPRPPASMPPVAHRPDQSIGSIGHDDTSSSTANAAAVKEVSGATITPVTTTTTATIPQEDEPITTMTATTTATILQEEEANDRGPTMNDDEEDDDEEESVVTWKDGKDGDGENEEEAAVFSGDEGDTALLAPPAIVRRSWDEAEEQEKRDAREEVEEDADIDAAEGRDDSNADDTDGSIEVQPNEKRSVLALVSEGVVDRVQSSNQRRALFLLDARGVPYEKVDGMDPEQREVRDGLFELAGFGGGAAGNGRAVCYPQFFFVGEHGTISYVGDFDRLLSLNDASDIPKEILEDHPDLETWERVFVNLVEPAVIASP